jgi:hypothetical protein
MVTGMDSFCCCMINLRLFIANEEKSGIKNVRLNVKSPETKPPSSTHTTSVFSPFHSSSWMKVQIPEAVENDGEINCPRKEQLVDPLSVHSKRA